ncbi:hypothetical protein [Niallia sp. Man26]|uniref:hypothetical protein n=1 Tax=Niallia sp. Man26 TaxID=2912824 RepID=UPI001EDA2155|nr:hypothetical protein [Niallia sp. Man26]UPO89219.1 hypothetical protein L8T27_008770 [Niallia sp. Man26]
MITEKYNLNQSTLDFLMEYTKLVKSGVVISNQELIDIFKLSKFYVKKWKHIIQLQLVSHYGMQYIEVTSG